MLGQVGSHLQRRVHGHIKGKLVGYRSVDMRIIPRIQLGDVHHEDSRSIVHRAALQARERKQCHMERPGAAESLVLCTAGGLVADKVRIGPAQAGRAHGLVGIDHDMVLGGLLYRIQVMVVHPLSVMVLSARDYVTYITALDGIVPVPVHKVVCGIHMPFIVPH